MSVVGLHRLRFMRLSLATWLAVVAALTPLLMPVSPSEAGIVGVSSGIGDLFASELCSVTRATENTSGDSQTPIHDSHQHCPVCRTVQQLGPCDVTRSVAALAIVRTTVDEISPSVDVVRSFKSHSSAQPRAPPVRV